MEIIAKLIDLINIHIHYTPTHTLPMEIENINNINLNSLVYWTSGL